MWHQPRPGGTSQLLAHGAIVAGAGAVVAGAGAGDLDLDLESGLAEKGLMEAGLVIAMKPNEPDRS